MRDDIKYILKNYSISQPSEKCFTFWKEKSSSGNRIWKVLSNIAESYLTPYPTTTDVERLFSTAGDIITNERNKLNPANAKKILFLEKIFPKLNLNIDSKIT